MAPCHYDSQEELAFQPKKDGATLAGFEGTSKRRFNPKGLDRFLAPDRSFLQGGPQPLPPLRQSVPSLLLRLLHVSRLADRCLLRSRPAIRYGQPGLRSCFVEAVFLHDPIVP